MVGVLSAQEAGRAAQTISATGGDSMRSGASRLHDEVLSALGGQGGLPTHWRKEPIGHQHGVAFHN